MSSTEEATSHVSARLTSHSTPFSCDVCVVMTGLLFEWTPSTNGMHSHKSHSKRWWMSLKRIAQSKCGIAFWRIFFLIWTDRRAHFPLFSRWCFHVTQCTVVSNWHVERFADTKCCEKAAKEEKEKGLWSSHFLWVICMYKRCLFKHSFCDYLINQFWPAKCFRRFASRCVVRASIVYELQIVTWESGSDRAVRLCFAMLRFVDTHFNVVPILLTNIMQY